MAIQLAPITIVIERNVARVRTDKGRRMRRAVSGRERRKEKMVGGVWVWVGGYVCIPVGSLMSAYIMAREKVREREKSSWLADLAF